MIELSLKQENKQPMLGNCVPVDLSLTDGSTQCVGLIGFSPRDTEITFVDPTKEGYSLQRISCRKVSYLAFGHKKNDLPIILEEKSMVPHQVNCSNNRHFSVLIRPDNLVANQGFFGYSQSENDENAYIFFYPWGVEKVTQLAELLVTETVNAKQEQMSHVWSEDGAWDFLAWDQPERLGERGRIRWSNIKIPAVAMLLQRELNGKRAVDRSDVDTHQHVSLMMMFNAIIDAIHALGEVEFQIDPIQGDRDCWIRFMSEGQSVWSFPLRVEVRRELVGMLRVLSCLGSATEEIQESELRWRANDEDVQVHISLIPQGLSESLRLTLQAND